MDESATLSTRRGAGEVPMSGAIALAKAIRALRLDKPIKSSRPGAAEITSSDQVAFVLADGGQANPGHAVLRLHPEADRSIAKQLREKLMHSFEPYRSWLSRIG